MMKSNKKGVNVKNDSKTGETGYIKHLLEASQVGIVNRTPETPHGTFTATPPPAAGMYLGLIQLIFYFLSIWTGASGMGKLENQDGF